MFYNYLKSIYRSVKNNDNISGKNDNIRYYIGINNKILNDLTTYNVYTDIGIPYTKSSKKYAKSSNDWATSKKYANLIGGVINNDVKQAQTTANEALGNLIEISKTEIDTLRNALKNLIAYIEKVGNKLDSVDLDTLKAQLTELDDILTKYNKF